MPIVAQSSHLQNYDYDPETQVLTIQFQNGAVYQYSGVPSFEFENLRQNGGSGTLFWSRIRDRYNFQKVSAGQNYE